MPETTTTETATNPTEAVTSTEAAASTLLGSEPAKTGEQQQQNEAAKPGVGEQPKVAEPAKVEGAPEKYSFTAPEGKGYDASILTAFEASAREANLTQDAAQKLLDSMSPKIAERQAEQVASINREWLESSKSDKEFGGAALEANLGTAKKALDKFGSPELSKLLGSTGLGNHPEVIRAFYRVGKAISEDTFVGGSAPAKQSNAAAVLYDNTK